MIPLYDTYYLKHVIVGILNAIIKIGYKINEINIDLFNRTPIEYFHTVFRNLEPGFKLSRIQILPFFITFFEDSHRTYIDRNARISIEEIIELSGYKLTLEDVKLSLEIGSNLWKNDQQLGYSYIKYPEFFGIVPNLELFNYCKTIPILPLEYNFIDVPKHEYDQFKKKMDIILAIRTSCDRKLTLPKFKNIIKKFKNTNIIDVDIVRTILLKCINGDIIKHLLSLGVKFTDEQINHIITNSSDTAIVEFWKYYKTKTDNYIKHLESQLSESQLSESQLKSI